MTYFSTVVTREWRFAGIGTHCIRDWKFKAGMQIRTCSPIETESRQVVGTEHPSHMLVLAQVAMSTESSIKPRTRLDLHFRFYVQKWTVFVAALAESRVEVALGHAFHIILMKELTIIPLLTQASQPMLAHHRLVTLDVAVRTICALAAAVLKEECAYSCS